MEFANRTKLTDVRTNLIKFKLVKTLVIEFNNSIKQYSSSKDYSVINESGIDDLFESIYTTIVLNKQKYLGKDSGCINDSAVSQLTNISKYNPLAGSSYIRLQLSRLYCLKKGLTNIQNVSDNRHLKMFYEWYKISSQSYKYSQN